MIQPATDHVARAHYASFREFYLFYLSEHSNRTCRLLHFIGSSLVIGIVIAAILQGDARWFLLAPIAGYGFAWVGHFVFEKNRSASFKQPLYSLMGDWVMYRDMLLGRIKL